MKDMFDADILCNQCRVKTKKGMINKEGMGVRYLPAQDIDVEAHQQAMQYLSAAGLQQYYRPGDSANTVSYFHISLHSSFTYFFIFKCFFN